MAAIASPGNRHTLHGTAGIPRDEAPPPPEAGGRLPYLHVRALSPADVLLGLDPVQIARAIKELNEQLVVWGAIRGSKDTYKAARGVWAESEKLRKVVTYVFEKAGWCVEYQPAFSGDVDGRSEAECLCFREGI